MSVPPTPSARRRVLLAIVLGVAGLVVRAPRCGADDEQPIPPRVFFGTPDAVTAAEIDRVIDTSFGDVTKAVVGRDVLVRRYGLVAVSRLLERIRAGSNETIVRNAILTVATLRRELGPSPHLWPAIPALTAVLRKDGSDPWRRAFAALALGTFYGPETARRGPASREGTRAGAEAATKDLLEADAALLRTLTDGDGVVASAASLAIGKIGGMGLFGARAAQRRAGAAPAATPDAWIAELLATGLLPGDDDPSLTAALVHRERRVRAAAALAIAAWAVAEARAAPSGALAAASAARAREFDALLRPERNAELRASEVDGAEALFARGALALVTDRLEPFEEIFDVAVRTGDRRIAVACGQALLFAPRQSTVRPRLAELLTKENVGGAVQEPVIAAALLVAGTDGTEVGVDACKLYLRNRGRLPRGRIEWDVRYHAVVGLVRALLAGRVPLTARDVAARALVEAARAGLEPDDPKRDAAKEGRSFRELLRDLARPLADALASNPDARPDALTAGLLEAAFVDPDALTARDPTDVVVDRLNDQVIALYGLDALPKAASGTTGGRVPSTADPERRLLLGWLERTPYFTRLDLLRDRGRAPAPPATTTVDDGAIDVEPSR